MNALVPISSGAAATAAALPVADIEVTAETGDEMQQCQGALIKWARAKLGEAVTQSRELKLAFEHAVKRKWKSDTLKRHAALALKRFTFYHKFLEALKHGYQIVPTFPVTLFAIRTDKGRPLKMLTENRWSTLQQQPNPLPEGEGEYKNPFPIIFERTIEPATQSKNAVKHYWAEAWRELEFPISMSKPKIMEAATRAMAHKIFDEFGICPSAPKVDPMIIGNIVLPGTSPNKSEWKRVSFIIAWHLNTATI